MICRKCIRENCKILQAVSNLQKKAHADLSVRTCIKLKKKEGKKLLRKFFKAVKEVLLVVIAFLLEKIGNYFLKISKKIAR